MTTPILKIPEVADGQINQYLTYNDALRDLESSTNDFLVVDLTAGDYGVTNDSPTYIFSRYFLFKTDGNTVARSITVPSSKRFFAVQNGGSATLTVTSGSTSIGVTAGDTILFYHDGVANGLYAVAGGGGWDSAISLSSTAGVATIDLSAPAGFVVSLDENVTTLNFSNIPSGKYVVFAVTFLQDGTGGWEITWPASVQGTPAQPNATAGSVTIMSFATWDGGTTIYQAV